MAVVIDQLESTVEPDTAPNRGAEAAEIGTPAQKPPESLWTELRRMMKRQMRLKAD